MIIVRNVFRLHFGKAREMRALWNEWQGFQTHMPGVLGFRALTDSTGESYTFVLEIEVASLAAYEAAQATLFADAAWQDFYRKVVPLCQSGYREIYNVVGSVTADQQTRAAAGAMVA